MPVANTDILCKLSGGASNANVNASLGGVMSANNVNFAVTMDNLFDNITDSEATSGDVEYRCIYFKNNHATDTLTGAKVYVNTNTPSADTAVTIGVDPIGKGNGSTTGVATTIATENDVPASVVFSAAATAGAALALGTLGPQEACAVWIKRIVNAATAPFPNDPFTLRVIGTP